MISCTEFVPVFSELLNFLEDKYGREEVDNYWAYLFNPTSDGIPIINYIKKDGIRGCFNFWAGSLSEEAADFTMYLNEKAGWFLIKMHSCPSKGRLIKYSESLGIKPYKDYCLQCDSFRFAIEKMGLNYVYNFIDTDKAACTIFVSDPKVFDGRMIMDENTEVMDTKASDNEYFHKDFHSTINIGIEYLGSKYGSEVVREFLKTYTKNVYRKFAEGAKDNALSMLKEKIEELYKMEKSEDALSTILEGNTLKIKASYNPAVKHITETKRVVSEWYVHTTETVMQTLAELLGLGFKMESYDPSSGKCEYTFFLSRF